MVFMDSDVYKWLEALGWELGREPSAELAALGDACIGLIAAAQEDDGYLNSYYQVGQAGPSASSNLAWDHELYCAGHLIQAAVAHARGARRRRGCSTSRRRFADLLVRGVRPRTQRGHARASRRSRRRWSSSTA